MRRALACAAVVLLACTAQEAQSPRGAPLPRASVLVDPHTLSLGQVGRVDVAIVTPPGHGVAPLLPPRDVPGLWILDWEADPPERQAERWLLRVHFRVRAREVGAFTWPALRLELEGPEGERSTLATEPQPFRVASELEAQPRRAEPYPLRGAPEPRGWLELAAAAAAGAGATLLVLTGLVIARRRRHPNGDVARTQELGGADVLAAWHEAQRALEEAAQGEAAAERGARALRRYVVERFGVAIEAHTTEELARARAPLVLATRWSELVSILGELDRLRFQDPARPGRVEETRSRTLALERARRFVRDTAPQESRA